jgi:hypothetical protein
MLTRCLGEKQVRQRSPLRIIFGFVAASRYRGAMKALAVIGFGLMNPLERLLRTRLRSIALFRELFFWRLRRELRK